MYSATLTAAKVTPYSLKRYFYGHGNCGVFHCTSRPYGSEEASCFCRERDARASPLETEHPIISDLEERRGHVAARGTVGRLSKRGKPESVRNTSLRISEGIESPRKLRTNCSPPLGPNALESNAKCDRKTDF